MLVEKNSTVLQYVSIMKKPWSVHYDLDRNYFDMHNCSPNDILFDNTIKLMLNKIAFLFRAFNSDELLHFLTPDENDV